MTARNDVNVCELDEILDRLVAMLREEDLPVLPGLSDSELTEVEGRLGLTMPDELRHLYRRLGGVADYQFDRNMVWLHPAKESFRVTDSGHCYDDSRATERMREELDRYVVFADFMIASHEYAVRWGGADERRHQGDVIEVIATTVTPIAGSITEFLRRYLEDPESVGAIRLA